METSCGVVLVNLGSILLLQYPQGHWDLPKGHVEKDDDNNYQPLQPPSSAGMERMENSMENRMDQGMEQGMDQGMEQRMNEQQNYLIENIIINRVFNF